MGQLNDLYNVNEKLPTEGDLVYLFTAYPFNPWKYEGTILQGVFEGEFQQEEDEFTSELVSSPKFRLKPDDILCTGIQYWGYADDADVKVIVRTLKNNLVEHVQTDTTQQYGGTNSYYDVPVDAKTLNDLIDYKNIPWNLANIFKAIYRIGDKPGVEVQYDLEKIRYYIDRELKKQGIKYGE